MTCSVHYKSGRVLHYSGPMRAIQAAVGGVRQNNEFAHIVDYGEKPKKVATVVTTFADNQRITTIIHYD